LDKTLIIIKVLAAPYTKQKFNLMKLFLM